MKKSIKITIVVSSFSILTGCASALLSTAFNTSKENGDKTPVVNQQALHAIQSLRALQDSRNQSHTFTYDKNNEQLAPIHRYKLIQLVKGLKHNVIMNIGPATAPTSWQQLSITNKRAEALKQLVNEKNKLVSIIFVPELSKDTVNIVVGA